MAVVRVKVRVREYETLDSALNRFKQACAKSGVLREYRQRVAYSSPGEKRRNKATGYRERQNCRRG